MKKCFLTGLALLLPIVLTIVIVMFIVNILTKPFIGTVATAFNYYGILNKPFLFMSGQQVLIWSSKLIVLLGIIILTLLVGFLAEMFVLRWFGKMFDYLIHRIPVIKTIYKATQDVVSTLHQKSNKEMAAFSTVVLVPFPQKNTYNIGLITSHDLPEESDPMHQGLTSVFVPGTPNPTMGFMLLYRKEQLIPLNIKVDEALKFIVSCGVVYPYSLDRGPDVPHP